MREEKDKVNASEEDTTEKTKYNGQEESHKDIATRLPDS
jgi:hypothetical protein